MQQGVEANEATTGTLPNQHNSSQTCCCCGVTRRHHSLARNSQLACLSTWRHATTQTQCAGDAHTQQHPGAAAIQSARRLSASTAPIPARARAAPYACAAAGRVAQLKYTFHTSATTFANSTW